MADKVVYEYIAPTMLSPDSKIWASRCGKKFEESYCDHCEIMSLTCPSCGLGSCSGSGCDYCNDAFTEYLNGR